MTKIPGDISGPSTKMHMVTLEIALSNGKDLKEERKMYV